MPAYFSRVEIIDVSKEEAFNRVLTPSEVGTSLEDVIIQMAAANHFASYLEIKKPFTPDNWEYGAVRLQDEDAEFFHVPAIDLTSYKTD